MSRSIGKTPNAKSKALVGGSSNSNRGGAEVSIETRPQGDSKGFRTKKALVLSILLVSVRYLLY